MPALPTIFFGHGNPLNALMDNEYTRAWRRIGGSLPRPTAVLSISAHWFVPGTGVTIGTSPRTIHDFGGFPQELYRVRYPAPGSPTLARRVRDLLAPIPVTLDETWGLDHGTWSVLHHVHNLHAYAWGRHAAEAYDWAVRFEERARGMMIAGEIAPLVSYEKLGVEAQLSIPTPDHYLPLLYVLGTRQEGEPVSFPVQGVDGGSISMLAVRVGAEAV